MDGVNEDGLGQRGMTVEAARKWGKNRDPCAYVDD